MELVPIKLLRTSPAKKELLKLKNESTKIDASDFLEVRMKTNVHAKHLLAIEDASEMAKLYLQQPGVFEKIAADIKTETGRNFSFRCRKTSNISRRNAFLRNNKKGREFVMLEHTYRGGEGHYGMAVVNHDKKVIDVYDSMGQNQNTFKKAVAKLATHYDGVNNKSVLGPRTKRPVDSTNVPFDPQPTGGFVAKDPNNNTFRSFNSWAAASKAWELSQYDEMSQHHFCYVEAFIAMMKDLGLTNGGPADPRIRLEFIKKVVWGLILKYTPVSQRNTPQWKYFETNFKYIMTTRDGNGRLLPIVNGVVQEPPFYGSVIKRVRKIHLRGDIDEKWSFAKIMKWAGTKNVNNK